MENQWIKSICTSLFILLLVLSGYSLSESKKTQDRLARMEVSVAVCGDVAAYFAPDDEMLEGAKIATTKKTAGR